MNKVISLLLALCVCLNLMPVCAYASIEVPNSKNEEHHTVCEKSRLDNSIQTTDSIIRLNPRYEGVINEEDLHFSGPLNRAEAVPTDAGEYLSATEAANYLRTQMVARTENVTLYVASSESSCWDLLDSIFAEAMTHTGIPQEGDSIAWQYGGMSPSVSINNSGDQNLYTYTLEIIYFTTFSQEQQVNQAVDSLLAQLNLWDKTDYEKVCGVYDWICDHVAYDYAHLDSDSDPLKYTAYAALIDRTAVSQGYAVLLYRLLLELGVDIRVITGEGNGSPHAWNIVQLNDLYYNCDATWDAGTYAYGWFLRGSASFSHHLRNDDYETTQFHRDFPTSPTDYDSGHSGIPDESDPDDYLLQGQCGPNAWGTLYYDGTLKITGTGTTYNYADSSSPWEQVADQITRIVIADGITHLGDFLFFTAENAAVVQIPASVTGLGTGVFEYCQSLIQVTIPANLTVIGNAAFFGCTSLQEITIPTTVAYLGDRAFHACNNLRELYFEGDAPVFDGENIFYGVTATAYYPLNNNTWNDDVLQNHGGNITWKPYGSAQTLEVVALPDMISYALGDELDLTGIQVKATYIDGNTDIIDVDNLTVVQGDMSQVGVSTIVVAYAGAQAFFDVYVHQDRESVVLDASMYPESNHNYEAGLDETQTVSWPGAVCLILEFSDHTFVESNFDRIIVYDKDDHVVSEFTGGQAADVTLSVPGDTAKIRLMSDASFSCYGYAFNRITALCDVVHVGDTVESKPATCTADGYSGSFICEICSHQVEETVIPALGHDLGDWVTDKEPTCTEAGSKRRKCIRCDHFETEVIPVTDHQYELIVIAPTCTEDGYTTHTCACGESFVDTRVGKLGHGLGNWVTDKEPTCTEAGSKRRDCSRCDYFETEEIPSTDHQWDEGVVTREPTEFTEGIKTFTCQRCGVTREVSIGTIDHTHCYTSVVMEPTCTERGYTTYTCTCGHSYVDNYVDALGHRFSNYISDNNSTCTADGTKTAKCDRCEVTDTVTDPGSAKGHDCSRGWIHDDKDHWKQCVTCGEISNRSVHTFDGSICTVCGYELPAEEKFTLPGANMKLGGELEMFFYIPKAELEGESYYTVITKTYSDGREDLVLSIPYADWESYNRTLFRVSLAGISAKEMADEIYVTVYNSDGTNASETWTDSIRAYAQRSIANDANGPLVKTMMVDMLNYGAAAQGIFEYGVDDLANAQLTPEQQALATQNVALTDHRVKGDNYKGTSLSLKSSIIITFYFENITPDMTAVATFKNHYGADKSVTIEGENFFKRGNMYGIDVAGLVVADGRQVVEVKVYDASGNVVASAADSIESYVARMSASDALYEMAMKFVESSYQHLHSLE